LEEIMIDTALNYLRSPQRTQTLLRLYGHTPKLVPRVLSAAFDLCNTTVSPDQLLPQTREFFRSKAVIIPTGLDELPSCWLQDLPTVLWHSRKPHWKHLPYMISELGVEDGVLWVAFAQEQPNDEDRLTRWDELRMRLNLHLRPNLWTPLSRELERKIWHARPDLRADLFHLPS
jgi:hypothetical protein